ncbi:MAG: hypothetical protein KDB65_07270 [Calditrichaeota bacterium]|nr:hypothetical protein [Calditrichota bacterium]
MKTLKYIIGLCFVLGMGFGSALGQGIESCTQCICVADGSCDGNISSCNGFDSGCAAQTFTAQCSGSYSLRYSLSCSGETCNECFACVFVTDSEGQVIGVCHSDCANSDCEGDCTNQAPLTANERYKLYVCLRACEGGSCEECEGCVARGYVYNGSFSTSCDSIPSCNP